jgi:hypothetical protein
LPTFTDLDAATGYTFYAYLKETDTQLASPASLASATITTAKAPQNAPTAPTQLSVTLNSVTLTAISGAEYRRGTEGAWQASATFSGLTAGTGYTFFARLAETETQAASPASAASATITTTAKTPQDAPAAPTMASVTHNSITLNSISGAEYRRGTEGAWQASATFSGLTAVTGYTFYARLKETASLLASPDSPASATITTDNNPPFAITYGFADGDGDIDITLSRSGNGAPKSVVLASAGDSDIAETYWTYGPMLLDSTPDYTLDSNDLYFFDQGGVGRLGNGHHYITLEVWKDAPSPNGVPYSVTFDILVTP